MIRRRAFPAAFASLAAALGLASACGMPEAPIRTALVYGVSIYDAAFAEGVSGNLTYTDDDARSVAASLLAEGWAIKLGLADTQVAAESQDATREAIEADIAALSGTEGLVLFYYSGHGTLIGGRSYILPYGSTTDYSEMISADELYAMFDAAGLRNVVLILDSCNSGGFVDEGPTADAVPAIFDEIDEDRDIAYSLFVDALGDALSALISYEAGGGYVALSAAGIGELSWESGTYGHGVFTAGMLAAFGDAAADRDSDGYVSTAELYAYCVAYVMAYWNEGKKDDSYYYSSGQYADFYPRLSGTAREYALWAAP